MRTSLGLLAAASLITFASPSALAQFATGEDAIEYRQAALKLMGSHFGRMTPVAKREIPYDADQIKANMKVLNTLATLPWAGFASAGSEGGNAQDDVWLDTEGFEEARNKFEGNLEKLSAAVDAEDFNAFRVAFGNTGQSCKSCHDVYRKEK